MEMNYADIGMKVIGVIVLLIVVLFLLTWGGMVNCGDIPYWCDIYETVLGAPRVLIVYGDSGLGNPEELKLIMQDPNMVGANTVDMAHLDTVSLGNLKRYKLVIVEQARQINMEQLEMFMNYVNFNGGRLVWVGDAGVEKGINELENLMDVNKGTQLLDNAWARAKETETEYLTLNFDEFLGLRYVANYCEEKTCQDNKFSVGIIKSELTGDHPLIYGSSPALELRIQPPDRDFAIVKQFPNASNSNIVLTLDQGSVIQGKENLLQRYLPLIATSGIGERVAYYAYPVEYFVKDNNYTIYVKNMYYGMLGK